MRDIPEVLLEPIRHWILHHASEITAETLLSSHLQTPDQIDVFLNLLERARYYVHVKKMQISKGTSPRSTQMQEDRIRVEVHDWPTKFNFHEEALREYHPIHIAELIRIILERLQSIGIDASRAYTPTKPSLAVRKDIYDEVKRRNPRN